MINLSIPTEINDLFWIMQEVLRRAIDGTIVPLFLDYSNQRVLVGAVAASANPAKMEVTGDLKILGSANGFILPDSGGSGRNYRMTIVEVANEDGTLAPVLSIIRVN